MQHLEGRGTPVLYIGRTVLKGSGYGIILLHATSSELFGCHRISFQKREYAVQVWVCGS